MQFKVISGHSRCTDQSELNPGMKVLEETMNQAEINSEEDVKLNGSEQKINANARKMWIKGR